MAPTEKPGQLSDEDELKKRGFTVGGLLGEGSYAKVKWATSQGHEGKKVALKMINKKRAPMDFQHKFMPRELDIMKSLSHPNITRLFGVHFFNDKVVLVLELAGHGDLLEYIKLRGALPEDRARRLFLQLLNAVMYIHSLNIVHRNWTSKSDGQLYPIVFDVFRDLKCENILLDGENNVKLSDFGFSRTLPPDQLSRTYCGSAAYAAPEVLQGIPYKATAYDVWSIGVILYILVCGSMPYDDSDVRRMIKHQTERKVSFSRRVKLSEDVRNLIHSILEVRVDHRLTTERISKHTWTTSGTEAGVSAMASLPVLPPPPSSKRPQSKADPTKSSPGKREPHPMATVPAPVGIAADGGIASGGVPNATTADRTDLGVVATATIDGLSHNNSARDDQHILPRPLDKTRKTMQLNVISAPTTRNSDFDDSTTSTFQEILGDDQEEGVNRSNNNRTESASLTDIDIVQRKSQLSNRNRNRNRNLTERLRRIKSGGADEKSKNYLMLFADAATSNDGRLVGEMR